MAHLKTMELFLKKIENNLEITVQHMIDKDYFQNIINDIKKYKSNHYLLLELLKINFILINKQKSKRIDCHLKDILESFGVDQTIVHDIVLFSLLNKETDDVVNDSMELNADDLTRLNAIDAVIDYFILTETVATNRLEQTIVSCIDPNDKTVMKKLTTDIVLKYYKLTKRNDLLQTILKRYPIDELLDVACSANDLFIPLLAKNTEFTTMIYRTLIEGTFNEKKKCVYVLNKMVNGNPEAYIGGTETWKTFFTICETISEKQYHLVEPTFKLFDALNDLGDVWKTCITSQYLNHPHKDVVRYTIKKILKCVWCYDMNLLVTTLNNSCLYENDTEIVNNLKTFLKELSVIEFASFVESFSLLHHHDPVSNYVIIDSICERKMNFNKTICQNLIKAQSKHDFLKSATQASIVRFTTAMSFDFQHQSHEFISIVGEFNDTGFCNRYIKICVENTMKKRMNINEFELLCVAVWKTIKNKYTPLIFLLYDKAMYLEKIETFVESNDVDLETLCDILRNCYLDKRLVWKKIPSSNVVINVFNNLNVNDERSERVENALKLLYDISGMEFIKLANELLSFSYEKRFHRVYLSTWTFLHKNLLPVLNTTNTTVVLDEISPEYKTESLSYYRYMKFMPIKDKTNINDIVDSLNELLDAEHDTTSIIIDILIEILMKRYERTDLFGMKIKNLIVRCIDDLHLCGIGTTLSTNLIRLLCSRQIVKDPILSETISYFLETFSKNNDVHDDYSIVHAAFLKRCRSLESDLKIPMIEHLLDYVIFDCLLNASLFRKEQRHEHEICCKIQTNALNCLENPRILCNCVEHDFLLPCLSEERIRKYAMEILSEAFQINEELFPVVFEKLMASYRETYKKRYFLNSKLHLKKLRILQFMNVCIPLIIKQNDRILNKLKLDLYDILTNEAHQSSVKILTQWLLTEVLLESGRRNDSFDVELKTLISQTKRSTGQSVCAIFPTLYHLSTKSNESTELMEYLTELSMGDCFNVRYSAQLALKRIFEYHKKKGFQYEALVRTLERTKPPSSQDPYDLAFLNASDFASIETIYHDLPRLTGLYKTEQINDFNFDDNVIGIKLRNDSDDLRQLQPPVEKVIQSSTPDDRFENIQRKIETSNSMENHGELIVVASLIDRAPNLGGLSRTCEVFGVKKYVLNNVHIVKNPDYKNLSMSSERWVETEQVKTEDLAEYLKETRRRGYRIVGAEQTVESKNLNEYEFKKKTVLVLGNERTGIPANLLPLLDECLEIPQFGQIRSLNVHVAGALFVWEYAKQHCRSGIGYPTIKQ